MTRDEKPVEKITPGHDSKLPKAEAAGKEAQSGMSDLAKDKQKLIQFLKEGGRSGITNDFGKPTIVDTAKEPLADQTKQPGVKQIETAFSAHESAHSQKQNVTEPLADVTKEPHTKLIEQELASHLSGHTDVPPASLESRTEDKKSKTLVVSDRNALIKQIKESSTSGFTGDFGKLSLVDHSKKTSDGHSAPKQSGDQEKPDDHAGGTAKPVDAHRHSKEHDSPAQPDKHEHNEQRKHHGHFVVKAGGKEMDLDAVKMHAIKAEMDAQKAADDYDKHQTMTSAFGNWLAKSSPFGTGTSLDQVVHDNAQHTSDVVHQIRLEERKLRAGNLSEEEKVKSMTKIEHMLKGLGALSEDVHETATQAGEAQHVVNEFSKNATKVAVGATGVGLVAGAIAGGGADAAMNANADSTAGSVAADFAKSTGETIVFGKVANGLASKIVKAPQGFVGHLNDQASAKPTFLNKEIARKASHSDETALNALHAEKPQSFLQKQVNEGLGPGKTPDTTKLHLEHAAEHNPSHLNKTLVEKHEQELAAHELKHKIVHKATDKALDKSKEAMEKDHERQEELAKKQEEEAKRHEEA